MPDFELAHVTGILTPETVIAVAAAGIALGVFLWKMEHRVRMHALWMLYLTGITFCAVMASSRWVYGSPHWEAWIGIAVLWTIYIGAATGVVHVWRHVLRCRLVRAT